jgi:hypothetical protein
MLTVIMPNVGYKPFILRQPQKVALQGDRIG